MAGMCLLSALFVIMQIPSSSADQKIIPAESGQNVTLTCRAPNSNIRVLEWSRAGLGDEYVLFYRDGQFLSDAQHPSFDNRVDLQDRQMKDGDVSLILKNVTINDTGTYECRVLMEKTGSWEHSSIIYLRVDPPGQPEGHTEDGSVGVIIGLSVVAVVFSAAVFLLIYRNRIQCNQNSHHPPAEPQIEMSETFLNSESPAAEYNDRNGLEANNCHQHSTRIPDVTLTLENELLHPQETSGLLPETSECSG